MYNTHMVLTLEQKYLARDSNGILRNVAKKCIMCSADTGSENRFSCSDCFNIVTDRMMHEESGDPYR